MSGGMRVLKEDVKEESEKAGLKLSIQKTKIMASGPITSWQIDGERVEGLFQGVSSSHQVAKVLEFQLQHESFQ